MTKEQTDELRGLVRQVLEKQIDPKVLIALLDDIKSGQIRIENGVLRVEQKISKLQLRYEVNGWKVSSDTLGQLRSDPGEVMFFQKMVDAETHQDWNLLLSLCDQEIAKAPEWLTPYGMRAEALVKLGRYEEAVTQLNSFIERSAGDRNFLQLRSAAIRDRDSVIREMQAGH